MNKLCVHVSNVLLYYTVSQCFMFKYNGVTLIETEGEREKATARAKKKKYDENETK